MLYSFRRCPYAMRARLALAVAAEGANEQTELREVKLSDKPEAMLEASPKGTVPVLVLADNVVIDESLSIMDHALGRNDPEGWLDRDDPELVAQCDGPFKHALDRYKYHTRYDTDPIKHRADGLEFLQVLESRLETSANLCGEMRGKADAAIFPFVRQFAATDRDWFDAQPIPHIRAWLARHVESEVFKTVMVRPAPWSAGDEAVFFP